MFSLLKGGTDKPVILVVMHHRRDVAAYLDEISRHVTRDDVILTVDTLFWKGKFLKCSRNEEALSKVLEAVGHSKTPSTWRRFQVNPHRFLCV